MKTCQIHLIGNAGVLVCVGKTSVLIDGLYSPRGEGFHTSPIPKDVFADLCRPEGRLPSPDYLIFSHHHFDHLSENLLGSYLDARQPGCVFLPGGEASGEGHLVRSLGQRGISHEVVTGERRTYQPEKDLEVSFYRTRHLGRQFGRVLHYCILITLCSCRLLFTADVDFFTESLHQFQGLPLHAVFVNPLFYHNKTGQQILHDTLKARNTFIYHVPFQEDDIYHMQHMVKTDIRRYQNTSPAILLGRPKQNHGLAIQEGEQNYDVLY